jgi:hypothetical protein
MVFMFLIFFDIVFDYELYFLYKLYKNRITSTSIKAHITRFIEKIDIKLVVGQKQASHPCKQSKKKVWTDR